MDDELRTGPEPVVAQLAAYGDWLGRRAGTALRPVDVAPPVHGAPGRPRSPRTRSLALVVAAALALAGGWAWSQRSTASRTSTVPVSSAHGATDATADPGTTLPLATGPRQTEPATPAAGQTVWAPMALPAGWEVLDASRVVRTDVTTRRVQRFTYADGAVLDLTVEDGTGTLVAMEGGRVHGQPAVIGRPGDETMTMAWWIEAGWRVSVVLHDGASGPPSTYAVVSLLDGMTWQGTDPTSGADPASLGSGAAVVVDAAVLPEFAATAWWLRAPDGLPVSVEIGPLAYSPGGTEPIDVPGVGTLWHSVVVLADGSEAVLRVGGDVFYAPADASALAVIASALRRVSSEDAATLVDAQRRALLEWPVTDTVELEGDIGAEVVLRRPAASTVVDNEEGQISTTEAVCVRVRTTGTERCRVTVTFDGPNGWTSGAGHASLLVGDAWFLVQVGAKVDGLTAEVCAAQPDGAITGVLPSARATTADGREVVLASAAPSVDRTRWCVVDDDGSPDPAGSSMRERPSADTVG